MIKKIIKIIFKFLLVSTILFFMVVGSVLLSFDGRDIIINLLSEKFLSSENFKLELEDVSLGYKTVFVKTAIVKNYEDQIIAQNVKINYKFIDWESKKIGFLYDLSTDDVKLNENLLSFSFTSKGKISFFKSKIKTFGEINSKGGDWFHDKKYKDINVKYHLLFLENYLEIKNLALNILSYGQFNTSGKIYFENKTNKLESLYLDGDLENIPFDIYSLFLPNGNEIRKFLSEKIFGGYVKSGKWKIYIPKEVSEIFNSTGDINAIFSKNSKANILGNLNVENFTFDYDKNFPPLSNMNANLIFGSSKIYIFISSGSVSSNKIKKGSVKFDWGLDPIIIDSSAYIEGDVQGLFSFIDDDTKKALYKNGIDLKKIKGSTKTDLSIKVPITDDKVKFNIVTKVSNMTGKFFDKKLSLLDTDLEAKFNGESIKIEGNGLLNGHNTRIEFITFIDDLLENKEFDTKFSAYIDLHENQENQFLDPRFIKINSGKTSLDCHFFKKSSRSWLLLESDLTNLDFTINAISIKKPEKQKANLKIIGNLIEGEEQNFDLKIWGEKELDVEGKIKTLKNSTLVLFEKINYYNNKFSLSLKIAENYISSIINGELLDISETDFANFNDDNSEQSQDTPLVKIKSFFNTVKIRNNKSFKDFMAKINCQNNICDIFKIHSKMSNSDFLRFEKIDNKKDIKENNKELWELTSSDAGGLLKGFDITDKVKRGNIFIITEKDMLNGKLRGFVKLNKFVIIENKFLVRLVSFISMPGLIGAITNRNMDFSSLECDFSYSDSKINLHYIHAYGPFFDISASGVIDLVEKKYRVFGQITPSIWGLNRFVGSFPLIGMLISGGRKSIIHTPFVISDKFDN